jgi:hypothetical protein
MLKHAQEAMSLLPAKTPHAERLEWIVEFARQLKTFAEAKKK